MSLGVRTRFEIFKRDDFRCQYCGRQSPEVVLEVDHIVPVASGGYDDPINLRTSCWACNRGKSDVPLDTIVTGEDPHTRSIEILEREREIREHNEVLRRDRQRREADAADLIEHWNIEIGGRVTTRDRSWLLNCLRRVPAEQIRHFVDLANVRGKVDDWRYVKACARNWQVEQAGREAAGLTPLNVDRMYSREELVTSLADYQGVIFEQIRGSEYHRRQVGRCPHSPACAGFIDCVLRLAIEFLDPETAVHGDPNAG